jgi:septal ring factor EnvC (AmiA/AmiB activator)
MRRRNIFDKVMVGKSCSFSCEKQVSNMKGECDMRIGSALVILVVSWIVLGYLLSDNINTRKTLTQVQQQLDQVVKEKNALQSQLENANSENEVLKAENVWLIEQTTQLQEQTKQLQSEYDRLEKQYSDLQAQFDKAKKLNTLLSDLADTFRQVPLLALAIPILPTSVVAGYVVYQSNKRYNGLASEKHERLSRTFTINVTKDEMRQIEKARRGLPAV